MISGQRGNERTNKHDESCLAIILRKTEDKIIHSRLAEILGVHRIPNGRTHRASPSDLQYVTRQLELVMLNS